MQVKRINYETLETSLPEQQMRGKQVCGFEGWDRRKVCSSTLAATRCFTSVFFSASRRLTKKLLIALPKAYYADEPPTGFVALVSSMIQKQAALSVTHSCVLHASFYFCSLRWTRKRVAYLLMVQGWLLVLHFSDSGLTTSFVPLRTRLFFTASAPRGATPAARPTLRKVTSAMTS